MRRLALVAYALVGGALGAAVLPYAAQAGVAGIRLIQAGVSGAITVTSVDIAMRATIVSSLTVALDEEKDGGENVVIASESCTACDEPGPRVTRWLIPDGDGGVYAYGGEFRTDRGYVLRLGPGDILARRW